VCRKGETQVKDLPPSTPHVRRRAWLFGFALAFLAGVLVAELAGCAREESQTWDEAYHLLAGYRYWEAADFGINTEHPPLVKLLATIPLLYLHPQVPLVPTGSSKQEGFLDGRKFLYSNDADALLFHCRMAAAVLTLFLALLLAEAGTRMFGPGVGLLAMALAVFEPNLLAHGSLIDTDVAASWGLLAAVYAFYRFVKRPSALRLLECGLVAGICLAVKHSGILEFPILAVLGVAELMIRRPSEPDTPPGLAQKRTTTLLHALRLAGALAVVGVLAWVVLWSVYGFRFRARPAPLEMTPSLADYIRGVGHPPLKNPMEAFAILALARWKALPESYLYGLSDVLTVSAGPRPTYIFGKLFPTARWYYFPSVLIIKSTLGFLLLLLIVPALRTLRGKEFRREIIFLAIPPAVYLAVSMTSGLNVGVRHVLPVYPFLLLLVSAGAMALARQGRRWAYVVGVIVFLHIASSARAYPNYLAYSNEAWGGPSKTYRVLSDSNVDYGQSLKAVRDYLARHPIRDCWMAYFGSADPDYYHIPCKSLPDPFTAMWRKSVSVVPEVYEGTVLISATELDGTYTGPGELNPYGQFQVTQPIAILADSMLVFQGRFNMTYASALSRANQALELQMSGRLQEAIQEARQVVTLEPGLPYSHYALGYFLALAKQDQEARKEYETALHLARTVHPEYLWYWIPFLEARLEGLKHL
jgi:Dolichyl-phosphate-mannose-protein mannosyltransferase